MLEKLVTGLFMALVVMIFGLSLFTAYKVSKQPDKIPTYIDFPDPTPSAEVSPDVKPLPVATKSGVLKR